jgi:hypothetical protein
VAQPPGQIKHRAIQGSNDETYKRANRNDRKILKPKKNVCQLALGTSFDNLFVFVKFEINILSIL